MELRRARRFVVPVEEVVAETGRMIFLRAAVALIASAAVLAGSAMARDDGRFANSPLKPWFDSLRSGKGPCCSDADGSVVSDVGIKGRPLSRPARRPMDRGARRCRDHRAKSRRPDHGVASQGFGRDFDPLLSARQHDVATARPGLRPWELGRRQMDLRAGRADTRRNHTSLDSVGTSR